MKPEYPSMKTSTNSTHNASIMSVQIDDLKEFRMERRYSDDQPLSLVVQPDRDVFPVVSNQNDFRQRDYRNRPLDMQSLDFMGPDEAVKQLFCLPYSDEDSIFALHRVGNTLLVDSVSDFDIKFYADDYLNTGDFYEKAEKSRFEALFEGFSKDQSDSQHEHASAAYLSQTLESPLALRQDLVNLTDQPNFKSTVSLSTLRARSITEAVAVDSGAVCNHIRVSNQDIEEPLRAGSPYLPPPHHFMPSSLSPSRWGIKTLIETKSF